MSKPAIQLAPERHAQVKAIAAALGLSHSEVVARFINHEIELGTIPPGFEGVTIQCHEEGVMISFDDEQPVYLSQEGVADLSAALREFADEKKRAEKVINMQHNYQIERRGNGVKLTLPMFGNVTKSWSRDIARDVADLLAA